jgi:hypothetical protein
MKSDRSQLLISLAVLAACGGGSESSNPDRLYLALLDSELSVQLVEQEPEPF